MRQSGVVMMICLGVLTACGKERPEAPATQAPVRGTLTTVAPADSDQRVNGHGAPAGYIVQLDNPAGTENPSYTQGSGGRWDVRTGPAHILYAAKDTTRKKYSVTATFEQLEAPKHPEAFGVFIGGAALDDPAKQQYTYFLLRGDGKYAVKIRNGATTRTVTEWTPHQAIPQQSAAGTGVYGIRIDVDGNVAKVRVNGQPVTMFSGPRMPLEGIAGARINHNLHVMVTPVQVTRLP